MRKRLKNVIEVLLYILIFFVAFSLISFPLGVVAGPAIGLMFYFSLEKYKS